MWPDRRGAAHANQALLSPFGLVARLQRSALLGWLAGLGVLAIPGLGAFVAAGPIMAALAGIGAGTVVGGLAGALVGMGIPEYEAKRYEGKIREGNILISVHSEKHGETKLAKDIFEKAGAHDIATSSEAGVKEKSNRRAIKEKENEIREERWEKF